MKTRILIMRPDQPHETREVELPDGVPVGEFLKALHELVDPIVEGTFEHVYVLADFAGGTDYKVADMFVEEFSAMNGWPINEAATILYRRSWLKRHPETNPETLDAIYGPAVLFEHVVWK